MNQEHAAQSDDPIELLEHLRSRNDSRKCRMFAVACCRHIWNHLSDELRFAASIAEQVAAGTLDDDHRITTAHEVNSRCFYVDSDSSAIDRYRGFAAEAVLCSLFGDDDYPPIPTYATTCAIAAARAVQEVVYAEAELQGNFPEQIEQMIEAERIWQCESILRIFSTSG